MSSNYRVLSIDDNGNVLVDAADLFRVEVVENGRILAELQDTQYAKIRVEAFNDTSRNFTARAVPYSELAGTVSYRNEEANPAVEHATSELTA